MDAPPPPLPSPLLRDRGPELVRVAALTCAGLGAVVEGVVGCLQGAPVAVVGAVLQGCGVAVAAVVPHRLDAAAAALALTGTSAVVVAAGGQDPTGQWSAVCFVVLAVCLRGFPAAAAGPAAAVVALAASGVHLGSVVPSVQPVPSVAAAVALLAASTGSGLRTQLRYRQALELRVVEAEAARRSEVARGVAEERLRIARDLHDGVGHRIAVVGVHLGLAEVHLPAVGGDATRADLAAARTQVQAVLRETQQVLRVLRTPSDAATTGPGPTLGAVAGLVAEAGAGGAVQADLRDLGTPLGTEASAAVYRIVQEALTNAGRHGAGGTGVRVHREGDHMVVEVVNVCRTGTGRTPAAGGGHGLVGMRERAEGAGGALMVHTDGTLFWVRAHLPVGADAGARR